MKWKREWLKLDFWFLLLGISLWFFYLFHDFTRTQTDWIVWEDTAEGVIVSGVLPPFNNNPNLKNQILPRDWLVQVDQKRIYKKEVLDHLIDKVENGHLYLYFFKRKNTFGDYDSFSVLVSIQNIAWWQSFSWAVLWNFFVITLIFLSFTSIGLLLIIRPFLRTNPQNAKPLWYVNFLALALFCSMLSSYVLSFMGLTNVSWNIFLLVFAYITNALFWFLLFYIRKKQKQAIFILLQTLMALAFYAFFPHAQLSPSALASTSLLYTALFWASDRSFLVTLILGMMGVLSVSISIPNDFLWFAHVIGVIIPAGILSYRLLRLGNVGLVLNQSIVFLGAFSFILIAFLGIHPFISQYIKDVFYISLTELIILSSLTLIVRQIYIQNETRIKSFFLLAQQHKKNQIQSFESQINRFTHSDALLKAFEELLFLVWNPDKVIIFLPEDEDTLALNLRQSFPEQVRIWSIHKPLSDFLFHSELESNLIDKQIQLIIPLPFTHQRGFLLLGNPNQQVYTLEDSEILTRICFQLALTLDILQLLENEKLLAQKNLEANLTALRSQINPHFLFNTLNTISALIHDAPDVAEQAVEHLAFIFRYTLKYSSENFVSFKQEIDLVSHYLAIEKIRFGKRLCIHIQLEPNCESALLPAFAIQTAVENCIKHGLSKLTRVGEINIHVFDTEEYTICRVRDNGVGIQMERIKQGTGLNNVLTRFEALYHTTHGVYFENLSQTEGVDGTLVEFKIPKSK